MTPDDLPACPQCWDALPPLLKVDEYGCSTRPLKTLCDAHWIAKLRAGLTPEDWASLNATAKHCHKGSPVPKMDGPARLPPAPKVHTLSEAKHREQLLAMLHKGDKLPEKKRAADLYLGRPHPGGYYVVYISGTGGAALLEQGPGEGQTCQDLLGAVKTHATLCIHAPFELVLRRAATCMHARNHAINFEVVPGEGLCVTAGRTEGYYVAEAGSRELYPCDVPESLAGAKFAVMYDYLIAACGRWPLFWTIPTGEKRYPASKYGKEVIHAAPSHCAHAITWEANPTPSRKLVIMPMRTE